MRGRCPRRPRGGEVEVAGQGDGKITGGDLTHHGRQIVDCLAFNLPAGAGFTAGLAYGLGATAGTSWRAALLTGVGGDRVGPTLDPGPNLVESSQVWARLVKHLLKFDPRVPNPGRFRTKCGQCWPFPKRPKIWSTSAQHLSESGRFRPNLAAVGQTSLKSGRC